MIENGQVFKKTLPVGFSPVSGENGLKTLGTDGVVEKEDTSSGHRVTYLTLQIRIIILGERKV